MEMDEEGYKYPIVNESACINCNLCEKVCPLLCKLPIASDFKRLAYAVQNREEDIRLSSSSGGAFFSLAKQVINDNGVVYGCRFDDDFNVIHSCASTLEELSKFKGSKYVQSNIEGCFQRIKEQLGQNILVLFSGTPCQVSGLKSYLKKDYSNLVTIDLVCHGIPSPGLWKKFLAYLKAHYKSEITAISFRDKKYGYSGSSMSVAFANGKIKYNSRHIQFYKKLYFQDINSRPSCFNCQFKTVNRISDITIYDCWSMNQLDANFDDDKGTTWVIIQSEAGLKYFNGVRDELNVVDSDISTAISLDGKLAVTSTTPNPRRKQFFEDNVNASLEELINKYHPVTIKYILKNILKPILSKTNLLSFFKRKVC